ncbi:MAG TPA: response regulator [Syntrophaceae bacterium]|nr:response regulator [Syntrophaceae bacterium]
MKELQEKASILVVDDEEEICYLLQDVLEQEGYLVKTAARGKEAIEMASKEFFNLAIVDLKMPGIWGMEVVKALKDINPHTLIIINTAYASIDTAIEAVRQGAYDFIKKPFKMEEMILTIKNGIEKQRLALENNRLLQKVQDLYFGSLSALAATIDAKNVHTTKHSERVCKYAVSIAQELGLHEEEKVILEHACKLHDIGKIGIPDSILVKPGKLTPEEWQKVREHPVIGADILNSSGFLKELIPLVKYHHERYDGSGYPDGLKGEDIPKKARIIGLADAFEAMTSDRPYRKAFSKEEALEQIKANIKTQFDPQIADVLLSFSKHLT